MLRQDPEQYRRKSARAYTLRQTRRASACGAGMKETCRHTRTPAIFRDQPLCFIKLCSAASMSPITSPLPIFIQAMAVPLYHLRGAIRFIPEIPVVASTPHNLPHRSLGQTPLG